MSTNPQELAFQYGQRRPTTTPTRSPLYTPRTRSSICTTSLADVWARRYPDAIAGVLEQSPDLSFERRRVMFGADHFVTEYEISGTADGKPFVSDGADVFTLRDGLIARKDSYVDWLAFQRQVGIDLAAPARARLRHDHANQDPHVRRATPHMHPDDGGGAMTT